jgi:hypothetical protein
MTSPQPSSDPGEEARLRGSRRTHLILALAVIAIILGGTYAVYALTLPSPAPPIELLPLGVNCEVSGNATPAPCSGGFLAESPSHEQLGARFDVMIQLGLAPFSFNVTSMSVSSPFVLVAEPANLPLFVPAHHESASMYPVLGAPSVPGTFPITVTVVIAR